MTYLYERDDFGDLIEAAASFHGIANPAIVEKDYYVTEALRLIAQGSGDKVIFKGGTSLSKGWKLINRFSEDIRHLYKPFRPRREGKKHLAEGACGKRCPASHADDRRSKDAACQWHGPRDNLYISIRRPLAESFSSTVLLEAGIQSGTFPTEDREIHSLLAELLINQGVRLDTDELDPFILPLLHFRRTFVEKLYALHHKVEQGVLKDGTPIGSYARHYYDVSQLLPLSRSSSDA